MVLQEKGLVMFEHNFDSVLNIKKPNQCCVELLKGTGDLGESIFSVQ